MKVVLKHDKVYDLTFIKKNGELRDMVCKVPDDIEIVEKGYQTVWDFEANNYRKVNLEKITRINECT